MSIGRGEKGAGGRREEYCRLVVVTRLLIQLLCTLQSVALARAVEKCVAALSRL